MSQNPSPNPSPSNTGSANDVIFHLPLDLTQGNEVQSVSVKCSKCEKARVHEYMLIDPQTSDPDVHVVTLMGLTKRLSICTFCGTLKLTK